MSIFRFSRRAKYVLIVLATWVICLLAAEGVFRLRGDRTTEDKRGFYAPFENGSFRHLPNMDVESQWGSGRFSIHTDSLGLRCDASRRHGITRGSAIDVLFVGDSQGFGNGVNFEDTLAGRVADLAAAEALKVANASVGGHCLRNQLELVQWLHDQEGIQASHYIPRLPIGF